MSCEQIGRQLSATAKREPEGKPMSGKEAKRMTQMCSWGGPPPVPDKKIIAGGKRWKNAHESQRPDNFTW